MIPVFPVTLNNNIHRQVFFQSQQLKKKPENH